jgi:hypothetical protein
VKLTRRKTAPTDWSNPAALMVPPPVSPMMIDSSTQAMVSSTMPAAMMVWPMSRRMSFRSMRTLAMTGMAEIDMAAATNRAKIVRSLGLPSR